MLTPRFLFLWVMFFVGWLAVFLQSKLVWILKLLKVSIMKKRVFCALFMSVFFILPSYAEQFKEYPDGKAAYAAANAFIQQNELEKAVPIIADIITSGRDKTDLNGRMGYDWLHMYDDSFFLKIHTETLNYMLKNLENYNNLEQLQRIDSYYQGTSRIIHDIEPKLVKNLQEKLQQMKK